MRWTWKKRQEATPHPADHPFAQMWSAENPPIPPAEREAARQRLETPGPFIMIDFGDGPSPFYTGLRDFDDYRKAYGYAVHPVGFDRWGYRVPQAHTGEG